MGEDLAAFGGGIGIIGVPFAAIYLILNAIKWNEKKSIFLDCWFVYLGWMVSGIIGFLAFEYVTRIFPIEGKFIFRTPIIPIVIFQTCLLTAILYIRCRPQKEFSLQFRKKGSGEPPSLQKICETAFLISILTSLITWGLIAILAAMTDKPHLSYGLYD